MSRQTAFPGVIIKEIEATAAGGGKTLTFEEGLPEDIPSKRIQSFLDDVMFFGSKLAQDSRLVYNLEIAAFSKSAAHMKGRVFARTKNPFEPRLIEVQDMTKLKDLGVLRAGRNAYSVEVLVVK